MVTDSKHTVILHLLYVDRHGIIISGVFTAGSASPIAPMSPGPRAPSRPPAAALRLEMGPRAGRHSPASESVGFMEMCLTGCRAELLASTLNGLGPFLEDELSADTQPMRLWVRDTTVTLKVRMNQDNKSRNINMKITKHAGVASLILFSLVSG